MKNITKFLAKKLKTLRQEKGWSLDKAAHETGVSKAMLGQIERGESSPTISTLWKIADGFHTSFSSFLENVKIDTKKPLHRSTDILNFDAHETLQVTSLFPFDKEIKCEIFSIEISPHSEHLSAAHNPGVIEHVIVIEGSMQVLVNGSWQTVEKGEGLRFYADNPHGYKNVTAKKARFHNIIHYL